MSATESKSRDVHLPRKYFEDYAGRGLPTGTVLRWTTRTVTVRLAHDEHAEMLSDASHYASPEGPDILPQGLRASARRAVARLTSPDLLR